MLHVVISISFLAYTKIYFFFSTSKYFYITRGLVEIAQISLSLINDPEFEYRHWEYKLIRVSPCYTTNTPLNLNTNQNKLKEDTTNTLNLNTNQNKPKKSLYTFSRDKPIPQCHFDLSYNLKTISYTKSHMVELCRSNGSYSARRN